jgi:hypothetical protein
MTTESNVEPVPFFWDGTVSNGICTLRVRWNIQQVQKTDPVGGETRPVWEYEERTIPWQLDIKDVGTGTLEEITAYLALDATKAIILSWVKGSWITILRGE